MKEWFVVFVYAGDVMSEIPRPPVFDEYEEAVDFGKKLLMEDGSLRWFRVEKRYYQ